MSLETLATSAETSHSSDDLEASSSASLSMQPDLPSQQGSSRRSVTETEISHRDMTTVSSLIGQDWEKLAYELFHEFQDSLETKSQVIEQLQQLPNLQDRAFEMLNKWKEQCPCQATRQKVIKALKKLNKQDIVKKLDQEHGHESEVMQETKFQNLQQKLANIYLESKTRIQRIPWEEDDTMNIDDIYVELNLLKQTDKPNEIKHEKIQSFDEALKRNEYDIFPKRVIVQGKAGCGKTTFVSKISVDWAKHVSSKCKTTSLLQNYQILLAINLREIELGDDLQTVIQNQLLENADDVSNALNCVNYTPKSVILLVDGYDEYNTKLSKEMTQIIHKTKFKEICVVITTRPWKAEELAKKKQTDVYLEITGLTRSHAVKFIANYFDIDETELIDPYLRCLQKELSKLLNVVTKLTESDSDPESDFPFEQTELSNSEQYANTKNIKDAQAVLDYIVSKDMLKGGMLPLILLFVCLLWQDRSESGENMPSSKTHLYSEIVNLIIRRYCEHPKHTSPMDLQKFMRSCFQPLGKLALQGLLAPERGLLFESVKIKNILHDNDEHIYNSGLLSKLKNRNTLRKSYFLSFPHKSIQEYFAGIYIGSALKSCTSMSLDDPQALDTDVKLFLDYFDSFRKLYDMRNVIIHACLSSSSKVVDILLSIPIQQAASKDEKLSVIYNSQTLHTTQEKFESCKTNCYRIRNYNQFICSCLNEISQIHDIQPAHVQSIKAITTDDMEFCYDTFSVLMKVPQISNLEYMYIFSGFFNSAYENATRCLNFVDNHHITSLQYLLVCLDEFYNSDSANITACVNKLVRDNKMLKVIDISLPGAYMYASTFQLNPGYDHLEILKLSTHCSFDVDISILHNLKELELSLTKKCVHPLKSNSLEILRLHYINWLSGPFDLSMLPNIRILELIHCGEYLPPCELKSNSLEILLVNRIDFLSSVFDLKMLPNIKELELIDTQHCLPSMESNSLEKLSLKGIGLPNHHSYLPKLKELVFISVKLFFVKFMKTLTKEFAPQLTVLHLEALHDLEADTHLQESHISLLRSGVSVMTNLQKLTLKHFKVSLNGMKELSEALPCLAQLQKLSLKDIRPTEQHAKPDPSCAKQAWLHLLKSLQNKEELSELYLKNCFSEQFKPMNCEDQTQKVIQALCDTLIYLPKLTTLSLAKNHFGDSLQCLVKSLCHVPKLYCLDLSGNMMTEQVQKKLSYAVPKHIYLSVW